MGESAPHIRDLTGSNATGRDVVVQMEPFAGTSIENTPLMDDEDERDYKSFSETCTQSVRVYNYV